MLVAELRKLHITKDELARARQAVREREVSLQRQQRDSIRAHLTSIKPRRARKLFDPMQTDVPRAVAPAVQKRMRSPTPATDDGSSSSSNTKRKALGDRNR